MSHGGCCGRLVSPDAMRHFPASGKVNRDQRVVLNLFFFRSRKTKVVVFPIEKDSILSGQVRKLIWDNIFGARHGENPFEKGVSGSDYQKPRFESGSHSRSW